MQALLKLSRGIDRLNALVGKYVIWLILGATIISALNAIVRKAFTPAPMPSWKCSGTCLQRPSCWPPATRCCRSEHVKIDVIKPLSCAPRSGSTSSASSLPHPHVPDRAVLRHALLPAGAATGEMSSNAGGLIRWPVYLMMPLGFGLLLLQGISELIKRIAFLMG
jgi:TRAP-type mannitol/chloroaromatic compound transport system permease small subunit